MANMLRRKINQALVYLRATEAVSRPIAFLMALFVIFFFLSGAFGIFLLGRWGYRQIADVNQTTNITTPTENNVSTTTQKPENNSSKQVNDTAVTAQSSEAHTAPSTNLPNTGMDYSYFLTLVITGFIGHQVFLRVKNSLDKSA